MKVNQKEIAAKLKKLGGVISARAKGTPADGVLFRDNCLYAENLEMGIKTVLEAEETEGRFIIPRSAIDFICSLPDGNAEITGNDSTVSVKSGSIKNKYKTFPAGQYPVTDTVLNEENNAEIESEEFLNALESVLYPVRENAFRENLKGVLLDASGGELNIVGCDNARLAWNKIGYNGEFKVIVPKQAVKQLLSAGIKGSLSFAWDDKHIVFKTDEYEISSGILSGEFPAYKKLVIDYENKTLINRRAFAECLKRSLICYGDKEKGALKCRFNGKNISVSLIDGTSEYEEVLELKKEVLNPLEIGFNAKYLLDAVNSFKDDELNISFGSPVQPVVIEKGNLTALVQPVRLQR